MSSTSNFQKYVDELTLWDERMTAAAERINRAVSASCKAQGLTPYETHYKLVTDAQMVNIIPYTMMPKIYRHAKWGKDAQQWRQKASAGGFHIFEAVINANPSYCYLGTTNPIERQLQVMAHAKWGHVDFFANNHLFAETMPESVLSQFAQDANLVDRLARDPHFKREGVDHILDAAHALQWFCGWLPTFARKSEEDLRRELMDQRTEFERELDATVSGFEQERLGKAIKDLEERLKRHPLAETDDLLGFLCDPRLNPTISEDQRSLIEIVRRQGRYFQPQARTKFMNEGWANFWERHLLAQPEMGFPFEMGFELAVIWQGHARQVTNNYLDPYQMGRLLWEYINRTRCKDTEVTEDVSFEVTKRVDSELVKTGETITTKAVQRDYSEMFRIRREYDDARFIEEFMSTELFEEINLESLGYVRRVVGKINEVLAGNGWGGQMIFHPVPETIEKLMGVIGAWIDMAETAQAGFQQAGMPMFPIPVQILQELGTVLQIVAGYDKDKHAARRSLVLRTGMQFLPNIRVIDSGQYTDGVITLKHTMDTNFGPLAQSEAKDTLKLFCRLTGGRPCRLLTLEPRYKGGTPAPYEYFTKDGVEVTGKHL